MTTDANGAVLASATQTATFHGAGFALGQATYNRNLFVRCLYNTASSDSTNAVQLSVDVSFDGASTWLVLSQAEAPIALTTTTSAGEIMIPFTINDNSLLQASHAPQIRVSGVISGAGSTPSLVIRGDLTNSFGK